MPSPYKKEDVEKILHAKETANSMAACLNELEKICASPTTAEEKIESFNAIALQVGKLEVYFCTLCDEMGVYEERGARGGKVIKKKAKEEDFDFVEVD